MTPFLPALLLALSSSFLLAGYELIRSSSNTLFKFYYGVENLPYIMAAMTFFLPAVLYLYGRLISRYGPKRTLTITMAASGIILFSLFLLLQRELAFASGLLYLFREVYIVLIIEQFWSFIDSYYSTDEAKKLNGFMIGVSSLGAIAGGLGLKAWAVSLGTTNMVFIGGLFLLPAILIVQLTFFFADRSPRDWKFRVTPNLKKGEDEDIKQTMGLKELFNVPLLKAIMAFVIFSQVVSAVLGLQFQSALQETLPNPDQQTAYSGGFFAVLNGISAFFQFIITPLALRFFSPLSIHLFIPLMSFAASIITLFNPSLSTIGFAYMTFKSLDYSLFRGAKELLYIPLSFDARYRAKEVIDVFGYRFGKGGTSLALSLLKVSGVLIGQFYILIAVLSSGAWFALTFFYRRRKGQPQIH